jgi:ribosomal protein S18 acetylase RimI-like enzyme
LIHRPERTPPATAAWYLAHLHIDLQERARGHGLGGELIARLLAELHERAVIGVHLGVDTDNRNAVGLYEHLGFREIDRETGGIIMGLRWLEE